MSDMLKVNDRCKYTGLLLPFVFVAVIGFQFNIYFRSKRHRWISNSGMAVEPTTIKMNDSCERQRFDMLIFTHDPPLSFSYF